MSRQQPSTRIVFLHSPPLTTLKALTVTFYYLESHFLPSSVFSLTTKFTLAPKSFFNSETVALLMVSKSTDSAFKSKKSYGGPESDVLGTLTYRINQLKKQIQAERVFSVQEKLEDNIKQLEICVAELESLATSRGDVSVSKERGSGKMLSARIENPLCKVSGIVQGSADRDCVDGEEVVSSTTAKLPYVENIPPYTTWIFLDKNQRMAEDQSVVGKRRIYYDPHGSEALICSDSEEEITEPDEEKHEFSEGEDRILRTILTEYMIDEEVIEILTQFIGGTTSEIQERCNMLKDDSFKSKGSGDSESDGSVFLGKSLGAALDSFDNLFCRRCLVFDCRLHGCSQILISANERQSYSSDSEDDRKPCSEQCWLRLRDTKKFSEGPDAGSSMGSEPDTLEKDGGTLMCPDAGNLEHNHESSGKRRALDSPNAMLEKPDVVFNNSHESLCKKLKPSDPNAVAVVMESSLMLDKSVTTRSMDLELEGSNENDINTSNMLGCLTNIEDLIELDEGRCIKDETEAKQTSESKGCSEWKLLEKELYQKGLEIFGRNSCLIARNLLSGLRTCIEVSDYMNDDGAAMPRGPASLTNSSPDDNGRPSTDHTETEIPVRSRMLRKRGRTRKLKYSWKSAGHPSIWRRIADGKNQSCRQYSPCGCQPMCGKQCPCLQNGTCCEKYCGCSKSCKNRFRGCHCAKSQCRSRQCPCFAAGRECDPDVCRNCWVSCGDASLGEPPRRGEGQCGNMRLLLRQQQRILLAKSDVAGWGAFLKNPVNKNDYLGEYTGELISHREADKRGKIYDRANSSFLFDLNDQYVLDAYRKGDKLKFANHSSNPNCYAKVMLVAGDHRVGIFAKEHIDACEELFYDYRYGPDQAPIWARKPEGSKRDDSPVPQGRPKKHQSH